MSKKEKNNPFRLFSLFRKSAPVTAEEDEPKQSSEAEQVSQEEIVEAVRKSIEITGGSLIYSLWNVWKEAMENEEETEETTGDWYSESLEVYLEVSEEGMPLTDQELEAERQRVLNSLQTKVKQHPLSSKKKKKSDDAEEEEEESLDVDAEAIIYVSKNRMAAWAFILPPYGEGKVLSKSQL